MKYWLVTPLLLLILSILLHYLLTPSPHIPRGTVILICGASSGIGEELAYQAAGRGARLVLVARSEDKLARVRDEALARGAEAVEVVSYDFSDVAGSSVVVNRTIERFGRLDYMVLNQVAYPLGPFLAVKYMQDPAYVEKIFRVNLFSNIELALHAIPHLESSQGHMFVTSSVFGDVPVNYSWALYCASKHALNGFFYSLQQELLAKQSPVSLTVGNLGLIRTPDMEAVWQDEPIPVSLIAGHMDTAAQGMLNCYSTRPRTWTYPPGPNHFITLLWNYFPWYHEVVIANDGPAGYQDIVERYKDKVDLSKQRRFSEGYNEGS